MTRLLVGLNRIFRKPRVEGRESETAYSDWEYRWGESLVSRYLEPAGDVAGKRILDVGCGLGGKTVAYGEAGAREVFGADLSVANAEASARFAGARERSFRWGFFVCDAARLAVAEATFDVVVANDAMEHFAEPEAALAEMTRAVKPGGAVWIFFTPHFSPLGSHLYDYLYTPWCHLLFRRRHIERAIREVLRRAHTEWSAAEIERKTGAIMTSYDRDLNRMTIRRFERMVARSRSLKVTYEELRPAKYGCLKFLTHIPLLRELFTGTVICRLARVRR